MYVSNHFEVGLINQNTSQKFFPTFELLAIYLSMLHTQSFEQDVAKKCKKFRMSAKLYFQCILHEYLQFDIQSCFRR